MSAPLLFSTRQGSELVPSSRPRQPPRRNFVLLKGLDRAPVFSPYPPPSRPAIRRHTRLPRGTRQIPHARAAGEMLTAAATGVLSVSPWEAGALEVCVRFPRCWKNALGWSYLRGISAYAGRSILGIAVTWILGLEKANYWGNKTFKSVPSIPKNHGSPEKRISNDVWIPPNSVCVCGAVGAPEGA